MRAFVALSVDTPEARDFVVSCLGWRWVEWQESWSARLSQERSLPELGVWEVETPAAPPPDVVLQISAGDDALWGGPIVLAMLPAPSTPDEALFRRTGRCD